MGDQYPQGIDLSRWNPDWQPEISKSRGIKFVASRLSVGNYYIDKTFAVNYAKAKNHNLPFIPYHVVSPEFTSKSQMDFAFTYLDDYPIKSKQIVLDCELHRGKTQQVITNVIYGCIQETVQRGYTPIIYTASGFWNYHVYRKSFWKNYRLWVANYGAITPSIPIDWKQVGWKMWQYSADGNFLGKYYGVSSNHIDLNYFNGSEQEMYDFFNFDGGVTDPDPPPVEPTEQDYVQAWKWRTLYNLNIRTKPTTASGIVRTLPVNSIVEELERVEQGSDIWVRVGNAQYCALEYRGKNYLTPVMKE